MHPECYERFLAMKEEEKGCLYSEKSKHHGQQAVQFEQSDFNRVVLDFMINGMHQSKLLVDPTFETLLNGENLMQSCYYSYF